MFHLGKKAPTYRPGVVRFSELRSAIPGQGLPTIPKPHGGYGTDFGYTGWKMLGNGPEDDGSIPQNYAASQGAGDCVFAGLGHGVMETNKNAGRPVPTISGMTAINHYATVTGYDPVSGNGDNGTDVQTALEWMQTTGYGDDTGKVHKIGQYVSLEPGNLTDLWDALWLFEEVGIGIQFPESAMNQFNNRNQIWSVVPGTQIDGGHYVPLFGHPSNNVWTCVTWGDRQTMTPQFLTTYCDEAYAWIDPERYNAVTGETVENFKDADLEKYITLVSASIFASLDR